MFADPSDKEDWFLKIIQLVSLSLINEKIDTKRALSHWMDISKISK